MNPKKYIKAIKKQSKKILSSTSEARKFLISTGIYDKKGNLTTPYRQI